MDDARNIGSHKLIIRLYSTVHQFMPNSTMGLCHYHSPYASVMFISFANQLIRVAPLRKHTGIRHQYILFPPHNMEAPVVQPIQIQVRASLLNHKNLGSKPQYLVKLVKA